MRFQQSERYHLDPRVDQFSLQDFWIRYQIWSVEEENKKKLVGWRSNVASGNITSTVFIYVYTKHGQEVEELELHGHRPHTIENCYLVRNHTSSIKKKSHRPTHILECVTSMCVCVRKLRQYKPVLV